MVVNFVRQHNAQPGVTVTESKFLHDDTVNADREVDIVVEGSFDGDPMVTSIEVIEHRRPATVEWVERLIGKHRTLPTNRLMLVSKSGFSPLALATVEKEGGWVVAVRSEPVMVDGQLCVKSLFMDTIQRKPTAYRLYVLTVNGQWFEGDIPKDSAICDANGNELGAAEELVQETFRMPSLHRGFAEDAHHHPDRDLLSAFECGVWIGSLGYYLRTKTTGELYPIMAAEFRGEFSFVQQELSFDFSNLGNRQYGFAEVPILGHPVIWVTSTNAEQRTKLSWRTKDDKPLPLQPTVPLTEPRFPGLLELQLPPGSPADLRE